MTRRRWIADQVSGNSAVLIGDHANHLVRVLRARIGQEFDISTPGSVRRGRITSLSPDRVEFELAEELSSAAAAEITLVLSIFKFDRMEWAIEKCTELGVSRILPLVARRTDPRLAAASANRVERWQRIANQASEQSRRPAPPEIAMPARFVEAAALGAPLRVVLAESEDRQTLNDVLNQFRNRGQGREKETALAIGPEGGWTPEELQSFHSTGWLSASLGATILRAETAAIAATAIVAAIYRMEPRTHSSAGVNGVNVPADRDTTDQ